MIRVRISEDALQDLDDGFLFYEAQEPGLGDYFNACLCLLPFCELPFPIPCARCTPLAAPLLT